MPSSSVYFKSQLHAFHIFTIALPLVYYGVRGQLGHAPDEFGYTYLSLLGFMALLYHGFWLIRLFIKYGFRAFFIWNQ